MSIFLKSSHLWFGSSLAKEVFGDEEHLNWVYYPDRGALLVAAKSKTFFEKLHKTNWAVLKLRSLKGDRTWAIHELLIEHELDPTDRPLPFELKPNGIVSIALGK